MGLTNYAPVFAAVPKPLIVFLLILLALVCFILVIFLLTPSQFLYQVL